MPESIPQLENDLRAKEHELSSVSNAATGAGIGAILTQGSAIGATIGAVVAHDKEKKDQLERDIAELKRQIQQAQNEISLLRTKKSDLMNSYQNDKARFEAERRQKYNEVENLKVTAVDPARALEFEQQLAQIQSETREQEISREQAHQQEIDSIQEQINQLSL